MSVSNAEHVVGLLACAKQREPQECGGETMRRDLAGWRGPGSWESERETEGETARALDREQTPLPGWFHTWVKQLEKM